MSSVTFELQGKSMELNLDEIILTKRLLNVIKNQQVMRLDSCFSENQYHDFFSFLQTGEVPSDPIDQIVILQLLKEWDCHFCFFDSYRLRVQSQNMNGYIMHRDKSYPVNLGCLYLHSKKYQEFHHENPNEVFEVNFECKESTIRVFLQMIHNKIKHPQFNDVDEVFDLCQFLECGSLCAIFEKSFQSILASILSKQSEDDYDISSQEELIVKNIEQFMLLPKFCELSVSIICRIFQKSKQTFPNQVLEVFFKNVVTFHGPGAALLLYMINLEASSDSKGNSRIIEILTNSSSGDYICIHKEKYTELSKTINEQKEQIQSLSKKNSELANEKPDDFIENIYEAIQKHNFPSVKYLISHGCDINQRIKSDKDKDFNGSTPLHYAAYYGETEIAKYLVEQKSQIDPRDDRVCYNCLKEHHS